MMKRVLSLFLTMLLLASFSACGGGGDSENTDTNTDGWYVVDTEVDFDETKVSDKRKLLAMTDQGNDEIIVIDLAAKDLTAESAIVWRWSTKTRGDLEYAHTCRSRLDDVRLRNVPSFGGDIVCMTSSSGMVAVVSYPTGECLFNANAAGYGPHSIEVLPNGLVAVACSGNGNENNADIRIYSASYKTDPYYYSLPLSSAHGVLWDPETELLWALGNTELRAYKVGGTRTEPTLIPVEEKTIGFGSGGHDLSVNFNNNDLMWITYSGVCLYSKSKEEIIRSYDGIRWINTGSVKSINTYADGTTVMTVAGSGPAKASHNTNTIWMFSYRKNAEGAWEYVYKWVEFPGREFYKVRIFDSAYT